MLANKLSSELMPCNCENLAFRAFISAETYATNKSARIPLPERTTYSGLVVRFLLLLLELVALEHRPAWVDSLSARYNP